MATQTTGGGSTTSFSNTPQAKDDILTSALTAAGVSISLTEDTLQPVVFDVMANDLGGNAKTLFSVDNGINNSGAINGYSAADLLTQDTARAEATSGDTSLNGAKIWITADGKVGYDASGLIAQISALSAGEFFTDSFIYAIRLGNGTLSWATATLKISGVNDGPVTIADVNAVKEDTGPNPVIGNVLTNDTDVDVHDTHSVTAVNDSAAKVGTDVAGTYGTLHLNADGSYSYTLNNAQANVQALADGQTVADVFTYTNSDNHGGSSSNTLTVTVSGTNDVVSITSGAQAGAVVEDAPATPDPSDSLIAAGTISFTDVDLSDGHTATFAAAPANSTALGTFSLDPVSEGANAANGSVQWHYSLNNSAAQYRAAGQSVVEHYTVTVNDGHGSSTTQDAPITITGNEDAPTITAAVATGAVTEDTPPASAAGTIAFADVDLADSHTVSATPAASGYLGTFTPTITDVATGDGAGQVSWSFAVDNAALQFLAAGQTLTQTYTVSVADNHGGSVTQDVTITITGTNDAPVAVADTNSGNEDTIISGTVATNDSDVDDGATRTYNLNAPVAGLTLNADGSYSLDAGNAAYQHLAQGATTDVVANYTVTDEHGATSTSTLTITLTGTNDIGRASC